MSTQTAQIQVTKTASPSLSKVGDTVTYTITICNTGDTTLVLDSVSDPLLGGDITSHFQSTLASGACDTVTINHVVTASDPDPIGNTVTAKYTTLLTAGDTASVNLFQPSVTVQKSGPSYSKAGDTVTYTYTITNTSSSDTPNLILTSVIDVTGSETRNLTQDAINAGASNLSPGASVTFQSTYVVKSSDLNPLVDTVTVTYKPYGYPNEIKDTDTHSITLVHPDFTLEKVCESMAAVAGGTVRFRVNVTNTGDVPLNVVAVDRGNVYQSDGLAPGSTFTFTVDVPVPMGQCGGSVTNEVNIIVTLPDIYGLSNQYMKTAGATCPIVTLGRTPGFWRNRNGHAILDPNNDGIIASPVTIGANGRAITVNTIALSDAILANQFCSFYTGPGSCQQAGRSNGLQSNTLEVLMAQTLALSYNIKYIGCYSGQTVSALGCGSLLAPAGLPANATVNNVLTAANTLIGNSTSTGTTTQAQASAMINLISCLNRETF